jgi:hypothetical protein
MQRIERRPYEEIQCQEGRELIEADCKTRRPHPPQGDEPQPAA